MNDVVFFCNEDHFYCCKNCYNPNDQYTAMTKADIEKQIDMIRDYVFCDFCRLIIYL